MLDKIVGFALLGFVVTFTRFVLVLTLCVKTLFFPVLANAQDTATVSLVAFELTTDSGYSYSASVQIGSRVETLLLNRYEPLNNLNILNAKGDPVVQTSTAYRGVVKDIATSNVEVVIDGMFISGTISTNGNYLYIASPEASGQMSPLSFVKTSDPLLRSHLATDNIEPNARETSIENEQPRTLNQDDTVTHVARIGLVVDSLYENHLRWDGVTKAISVINSVDALYRRVFGLALEVEVLVLERYQGTILRNDDDNQVNLDSLREYRMNSDLLPRDLAFVHLFTGMTMDGRETGIAIVGSVCDTDGRDVGLVGPTAITEILTAHEIGHILGATHDDEPDSACRFSDQYIMHSSMDDDTEEGFSSCSLDQIKRQLEQSECLIPAAEYQFSEDVVDVIVDDSPSRLIVQTRPGGGGSTGVWAIFFIALMFPARLMYRWSLMRTLLVWNKS